MSRLQRRARQALRRGCFPYRWPGERLWDVYVEGEWWPRELRLTYRDAVGLAYRISVAKRLELVVTTSQESA